MSNQNIHEAPIPRSIRRVVVDDCFSVDYFVPAIHRLTYNLNLVVHRSPVERRVESPFFKTAFIINEVNYTGRLQLVVIF